jgi:hypothetical protein
MIRTLIKQELRLVHMPLMLALFSAVVLRLTTDVPLDMAWRPLGEPPTGFVALYILFWGLFLFFCIGTNITQRCSRLSLVLPVSTRRLWLVRIVSIVVTTLIPVAIVTVIAALRVDGSGVPLLTPSVLWLGAHTGAGLVLAAVLLQSPSPELYRIRGSAVYILYAVAACLAVLVLTLVGMGSRVYVPIFLGASILLGLRIYLSLPRSFSFAPTRPARGDGVAERARDAGAADDGVVQSVREPFTPGAPVASAAPRMTMETAAGVAREAAGLTAGAGVATDVAELTKGEAPPTAPPGGSFKLFKHLVIMRALINRWYVWLNLVLLGFYATMIVIAYYDVSKDNPYPFFMFIWIFAVLYQVIVNMRHIGYLPISRKTVFAHAMVPSIAAMLIGFVIGNLIVHANRRVYRHIQFNRCCVQIPGEFWEISGDGAPPVLRSPWGEIHAPEAYPLYRGSSIIVYKPYDCDEHCSPRFAALQLDRAAQAIHGVPFDTTNMYTDLDESFVRAVDYGAFTFEGSVGRISGRRSKAFAVGGIIAALFYTALLALQLRAARVLRPRPVVDYPVLIVIILMLVIIGVVVIAGEAGLTTPRAVAVVPSILTRKLADSIPLESAVLWGVFVAVCAACYAALQKVFEKVEASLEKPKRFLPDY